MSSCRSAAALVLLLVVSSLYAQTARYPGIGRSATAGEVSAWDIDVRADFKGLPPGAGSVANGMAVWEGKCASCHGVFGESNEVFTPLIGGTTAADVKSGHAARLLDPAFPGRTALMKLPTVSTLWDYIRRAMPWNTPKSLSTEEVYAVTAYMLHLGGVLPDDFVLSNDNIAMVQERLPNRLGMTQQHGLWSPRGKPDVRVIACMNNCASETRVASSLPEHARNAHGNLAEQNRLVGAQRGADTRSASQLAVAVPTTTGTTPGSTANTPRALLSKHNCLTCHGVENKLVGPALRDVAQRHGGRSDARDYLAQRIVAGSSGAWGEIAMPAQNLPTADALALAQWLAAGAPP